MLWVIVVAAVVLLFALFCREMLRGPRPDVETGLLWLTIRVYAALFHRLRVVGRGYLPERRPGGPLIVVCNHTAGIDPLLVQALCRFEIRWVMAQDMRAPALEWFWTLARIIFVDRQARDLSGMREAVRHVKAGGVVGIFPEGGLERPARTILPFQAGVGLLIRRTGAPVLPAVVTGTPIADQAFQSLTIRSNARVTFHEPLDYSGRDWTAEAIADDLRARFAAWTGWPLSDRAAE
jgi:1-acyl-sn-glycerol-3-phosphate acyltransferase